MAFSFGQPATQQQSSLFGSSLGASNTTGGSFFGGAGTSSAFGTTASATQANPNKDFEVTSAPSDSISALVFSPPTLQQNFLVSGSWDNVIRCWEVTGSAQTSWQSIPKAEQRHNGAVLDVRFSDVSFLNLMLYTIQVLICTLCCVSRMAPRYSRLPPIRQSKCGT